MAKMTATYTKAEAIDLIVNRIKSAQKHNVPAELFSQIIKGMLFDPIIVNNHERQEVLVSINEGLGMSFTMQQIREADSLQLEAALEANKEHEEQQAAENNSTKGNGKMNTDKATVAKNLFGGENSAISMGLLTAGSAVLGAGIAMFARDDFSVATLAGGAVGVGAAYLIGDKMLGNNEGNVLNYTLACSAGIGIGAGAAFAGSVAGNLMLSTETVEVTVPVLTTEQ